MTIDTKKIIDMAKYNLAKFDLKKIDFKRKKTWAIGAGILILLVLGIRGCKQDYSDPQAFFDKYFMEDWFNPRYGKDYQKAMHFKKLEIKNLRLDIVDGMSAVCAEVRLIPEPGVLYIDKYNKPWKVKTTESWDTSLSGERLDKDLSASIKIKRLKMDNGVFAPTEPVRDRDGLGYAVQGFYSLEHLQVYNEKDSVAMAEMLKPLVEKVEAAVASKDASSAARIMREYIWTEYLSGNQFRFIYDNELKLRLYNAIEQAIIMTKWNKIKPRDYDKMVQILLLLKKSIGK